MIYSTWKIAMWVELKVHQFYEDGPVEGGRSRGGREKRDVILRGFGFLYNFAIYIAHVACY